MQYLVNGIKLNAEISGACAKGLGDDARAPLVLLHGFTGSSKSWEPYLPEWEKHFPVIRVDIIGHGLSDKPEEASRYSMVQAADDLASLFDQLGIQQVNLLGYSMGGRLALTFAVQYPQKLSSLILESSSPGLAAEEERLDRIEKDRQLAERIERQGIPAFVDEWEQLPLFSTQSNLPVATKQRIRAERLKNEAQGLAGSLRGMGTGAQPSWWDTLHELHLPVLLLAGELDPKFCSIAERMHAALPNSSLRIVQNAGHTVHVEQSHNFGKMVMEFMDELSTIDKGGHHLGC